jgi:flagellin
MSSLLTNVSALTALQTLNSTRLSLESTQARISTGMRVATASDNAAYWSIATTMKSDNSALSAVKDALALGSATIDVASSALNSTVDVVNQIKSKLVAAKQPGVDRTKVQAEITSLQSQLKSIADSAVFSGQNWLSVDSASANYNATKSVVSSFSRDPAGVVTVGTIDVNTASTKLYDANGQTGLIDQTRTVGSTTGDLATMDISALTDSSGDLQTLSDYIAITDAVLSDVTKAASDLGASKTRITSQNTFVSSLMDSITKGVGSLVDADMNVESTRLQALQTQQQLGVQSLSIANQNSQMILKLFNG